MWGQVLGGSLAFDLRDPFPSRPGPQGWEDSSDLGALGLGGLARAQGATGLARDQGEGAEMRSIHPIERIVETPPKMTHWA